jgi:uncharacterized membrane protein
MSLSDFFYKYFAESSYGYNIVNTTVYSIILILFVYLIFKILKKLKVRIDKNLALAISPFVLFGSSMRVLEDSEILRGSIFVTPGIYFLIFGITFFTLLISVFIQKKKGIPYFKPMFILGLIFSAFSLGNIQYKNYLGIGYIIAYFMPWIVLLKIIPWLKENKIVTGLHMFDANSTFVSLQYFNYYEQHVLPRYFINLSGTPFSFVIIKFLAVVSILVLIDKYPHDKEFNNYIKLIIGILGAATGIRDFLRLFGMT